LPVNKKKGAVAVVDGDGVVSSLNIGKGFLNVPVSELPVYVNPAKLKIKDPAP